MTHVRRLGVVGEAVAGADGGLDVGELAEIDLAAEATRGRRPQEGDHRCRGEGSDAGTHQRDRGTVEELTPADTDHLGVGRHERRGQAFRCRFDLLAVARDLARLLGVGGAAGSLDWFHLGRAYFGFGGGSARSAIATAGLGRQGTGTAHIGPAGEREERQGAEHDNGGDDDGDDDGCVHVATSFPSQLEEPSAVSPRQGEVEARPAEERADHA